MARRHWRRLRLTPTLMALAAFEVNPLPFEAGRHWRHLRLTHTLVAGRRWRHLRSTHSLVAGRRWRHMTLTLYPLRRDGVGGI